MANRIPYDVIGGGRWRPTNGQWRVATLSELQDANDFEETNLWSMNEYDGSGILMWFAEPWDITGYSIKTSGANGSGGYGTNIYTSTDTVDGTDGSWTTQTAFDVANEDGTFVALTASGARGIRFENWTGNGASMWPKWIHIYGAPTTTGSPQLVDVWHPTLDQQADPDIFKLTTTRGQVDTIPFRVKNLNTTQQADNIVISADIITDLTPSVLDEMEFSTDDITYTSSITLTSLAADTISSTLYLRVTKDANALWGQSVHPRVKIAPGGWS